MNKNIKIILIVIVIIILIMLPLFLLKKPKANLDELETILIKEFDLRKLENEEISNYFGITNNNEETLFLTDFNELDKPFSPNTLVVIVNNRDYKEYYSALKGYIDTEINNTTIDRIELYQKAIIKTASSYFYLVISNDENIVKVIDNSFK